MAATLLQVCAKFYVDILTVSVHYGPQTSATNRTADQNGVSNGDPCFRYHHTCGISMIHTDVYDVYYYNDIRIL